MIHVHTPDNIDRCCCIDCCFFSFQYDAMLYREVWMCDQKSEYLCMFLLFLNHSFMLVFFIIVSSGRCNSNNNILILNGHYCMFGIRLSALFSCCMWVRSFSVIWHSLCCVFDKEILSFSFYWSLAMYM